MKGRIRLKKPYVSFGGHGVDVAINRADDLDKLSLEYFSEKDNPMILDLGSGAGGHSLRMANVGIDVTAIDVHDFAQEFKTLVSQLPQKAGQLRFTQGDVNRLVELVAGQFFSDVYMQRVLHYLKYHEAFQLLGELYKITDDRLYISVMGMKSEAGNDYFGSDVKVEKRFSNLSRDNMKKFCIYEQVCLYEEAELVALLKTAGWRVNKCWQSAFGNIKAICSH